MARPRVYPEIKPGQTYDRLEVVAEAERAKPTGRRLTGKRQWLCLCVCGTEKVVVGTHLSNGAIPSCGCLRRELAAVRMTTHGMWGSAERTLWGNMMSRCTNPKNKHFADYGGRGIVVCDRWRYGEGGRTGFECFYANMGPRPSSEHSIERLDNDGPYAPWNCIWALPVAQASNKRNNHYVVYKGERVTISEAARRSGVSDKTIHTRLAAGWTGDMLFVAPHSTRKNDKRARQAPKT